MTCSVVWFKRDLRTFDHEALIAATQRTEPIIPLYILEPDLWAQPDMSWRHYAFLQTCLRSLSQDLERCGAKLILRVGSAVSVLSDLNN